MPIQFDVKREKSTVRGGRLDDSARTTQIGTMRPSAMYTNGGITCSGLERRPSRVCHCVTKTRIQGQSLTTELRRVRGAAFALRVPEMARPVSRSELGSEVRMRYSPMAVEKTFDLWARRSEEHTSELQSRQYIVC